jgi:Predicted integral membrane protein (DUF2269)
LRTFALWLHILGGGTWLGGNVMQTAISRGLVGGDSNVAKRFMQTVEKASGPVYGTASVLILATGIYLVLSSDGAYSFGDTFVGFGIAVLVIGGVLAGLVFNRQTKAAIAAYESGNAAAAAPAHRSIAMWGTIDTVLVALAVLAMVAKW